MGFASFDYFKKLHDDIDNSTISGGLYSIGAIIVK